MLFCVSFQREKKRRFFGLFFSFFSFFFSFFSLLSVCSFVLSSLCNCNCNCQNITFMREPLTKTKTKKKEALRATLEKDDAQTDFSVKERIETAMMEVLGKRGLEKTC